VAGKEESPGYAILSLSKSLDKIHGAGGRLGSADGHPPRDTTPLRLSAVRGEKVNQIADFENRRSQIANLKCPDDPMAK
jgi:hypothetical protein